MSKSEHIRLHSSDLEHLLLGGELKTKYNTRIILSDIGYPTISDIANRLYHQTPRLGQVADTEEKSHIPERK